MDNKQKTMIFTFLEVLHDYYQSVEHWLVNRVNAMPHRQKF